MATMNAALLIVTAMAMRADGRKAFGLCKAPAQALFHSLPTAVPTALSLTLCSRFLGLMSFAARVRVDTLRCLACAFCTCLYFVAVQNEKVLWPQG